MKDSTKARATKKSKPGKQTAQAVDAGNSAKAKTPKKTGAASAELKPHKQEAVAIERVKLVRDSFTMPRDDYDLIAKLKARAIEFKRPTKKSELLRAGLQQLAALSESQLRTVLAALPTVQTGRPKKTR
ncbi:hypothetical protein [Aquimonas sp.]|jgi:hypothetical protein|uniref:hypothetical protein n=1 Tax=Aquimonas sp. TaxID=1872588 RepID=UPI0037BF9F16